MVALDLLFALGGSVDGVAVQADKQVTVPLVCKICPLAQLNEHVLVAGHLDVETFFFQFFFQKLSDGEHDVLFVGLFTLGAGILSTVTGVDDDGLDFAGPCGFVFRGSNRRGGGGNCACRCGRRCGSCRAWSGSSA